MVNSKLHKPSQTQNATLVPKTPDGGIGPLGNPIPSVASNKPRQEGKERQAKPSILQP